MKKLVLVLLLFIFLASCDFWKSVFPCEDYVPQKWHLSEMEAEFNVNKPVLNIGDTIHVKFEMDKKLYDIDNKELNIDQGVQMFIRVTTISNPADTIDENPFALDTTIFYMFDNFFEMSMLKGNMISAYNFSCEDIDDKWQLKIIYIPKKVGSYSAYISADEFYSSDLDLDYRECMEGDSRTFDATVVWKESEFNRINYLYQDDDRDYPSTFGFIVE